MKFEVYEGKDGKWYWRAKAKNGRVVANGAQGYRRASSAFDAVSKFASAIRVRGYVIQPLPGNENAVWYRRRRKCRVMMDWTNPPRRVL